MDTREPRAGQLIDFVQAEAITTMMYPPHPVLVVSGEKPYPSMEVSLVPLDYISRPQYRGIQVVGAPTEDGPHAAQLPTTTPYTVELELTGVTGTEGVEVVGATRTERITVPTATAATSA